MSLYPLPRHRTSRSCC